VQEISRDAAVSCRRWLRCGDRPAPLG
jgi:hypothetical protein